MRGMEQREVGVMVAEHEGGGVMVVGVKIKRETRVGGWDGGVGWGRGLHLGGDWDGDGVRGFYSDGGSGGWGSGLGWRVEVPLGGDLGLG